MPSQRKPARKDSTGEFLETPMYRLVDRHRAILEKIKTREDAEYWGHMLVGECYPEIPNSRSASGKLAALVGLAGYMDFYCAWGYYDLLKKGKALEEARTILGTRMAGGIKELTRLLGSKKPKKHEVRVRVGAKGEVGIPKALRDAFRIAPGTKVAFSSEGDRIVLHVPRADVPGTLERIARSGPLIRKIRPHGAYEGELQSRRP